MILTARRSEIECELSWWSSMTTARRAWSAFALQDILSLIKNQKEKSPIKRVRPPTHQSYPLSPQRSNPQSFPPQVKTILAHPESLNRPTNRVLPQKSVRSNSEGERRVGAKHLDREWDRRLTQVKPCSQSTRLRHFFGD